MEGRGNRRQREREERRKRKEDEDSRKVPSDGPRGGWNEVEGNQKTHVRNTSGGDASDADSDIPVIPDVEDEDFVEEEEVAGVPEAYGHRVQALRELDTKKRYALPSAKGDDIDLSILSSVLSPAEEVMEDDQKWNYDTLFANVMSEVEKEREPKNETDEVQS